MELRVRGWPISAAGREVGVSRTSANNWARGYKIYRRGEAVGFVPALDRLAVRQISDRCLSEEERIGIADLRRAGLTIRQIAAELDRAASTVSRELRRNSRRDGQYRPFEAHRWAVQRRARRHQRRVDMAPAASAVLSKWDNIASQEPSALNLRCHVQIVCHGPKTAGTSCQVIPHR
jgi:IS30 family transposase